MLKLELPEVVTERNEILFKNPKSDIESDALNDLEEPLVQSEQEHLLFNRGSQAFDKYDFKYKIRSSTTSNYYYRCFNEGCNVSLHVKLGCVVIFRKGSHNHKGMTTMISEGWKVT